MVVTGPKTTQTSCCSVEAEAKHRVYSEAGLYYQIRKQKDVFINHCHVLGVTMKLGKFLESTNGLNGCPGNSVTGELKSVATPIEPVKGSSVALRWNLGFS